MYVPFTFVSDCYGIIDLRGIPKLDQAYAVMSLSVRHAPEVGLHVRSHNRATSGMQRGRTLESHVPGKTAP